MAGFSKTASGTTSREFFGRKKELKIISEALAHPETGTFLLAIGGPAGIGKTSLIRRGMELHPGEKCFKLYGKFENHGENAPYAAFRQAFSSWARQILLLPDEEFDELKQHATSALQTNITAVTGIFRELEVFFSRKQLLGNTYKADSHQIKARFYYFLKKFLKSITIPGYRLIIFLDDLQWADKASFLLLEELVTKNEIPGLTFITAYRPRERMASHRPERIAALVHLNNAALLSLKPFTRNSIAEMIPREWNFSRQNKDAFANYLWLETGGNPLKIHGLISIVEKEQPGPLKPDDPLFWERLPKPGDRKDSVAFSRGRLRNLPFNQLKVIATASCLGYRFDSSLLIKILNLPAKEVRKHLEDLTKADFLIKKSTVFVFAHDTIFSAANSLLSNVEKCELHQKTAVFLLHKLDDYNQPAFFQVVNHLNRAHELSGSKKVYSAEHVLLNLQAARLAIKNSAFESAHGYLIFANNLFREHQNAVIIEDRILQKIFTSDHIEAEQLQYEILYGHAEVMFLLQKFEPALHYARRVLELNTGRHERIRATLIKIRICSALIYQRNTRHILLDGLQGLEQVLQEFGIVFPSDPEVLMAESKQDSRVLYERAAGYTENVDFTKLINPDKEYQDLIKLITTSMTFLYYMDVRKNVYIALKTLLMILDRGHAPVTPVLFSASFLTSSFGAENRELAHILGKLSLKMIEQEPFKRYSHVIYYIATLNFYAWEHPYRWCIEKLKESVRHAFEAGDLHYAAFCSTNIRLLNTYRGKNLKKHLKASAEQKKGNHVFFISSSDDDLTNYLAGNKPGFAEGNFIFSEDLIRESEHNQSSSYHYHLALQKLNYISGHTAAAVKAGEVCENLKNVYSGFQIELEHFFFYSLSLLQLSFTKKIDLSQALEKITPKLGELRRLSAFGSGNYLHKVLLIEAEIAKCRGDFEQATLGYDRAILDAKKHGFIHHAAIASERAFEYYKSKERHHFAAIYLQKCIKLYTRWGAMAKVDQLKAGYATLIKEEINSQQPTRPAGHYERIKKIVGRSTPGNNVSLPELARFLLSILLKEGRAKKAGILLLKENSWNLLAVAPENITLVNRQLKELKESLPVSVFNYCIKTGSKLVLQEIAEEVLFAEDPYIKKEQPTNVSVFPVKQSAETIGLIYLQDCRISSEAEKDLFLLIVELACTGFANAVYYENNNLLNRQLKLQERNRIEAVVESQENERQRIARELHDSLGQMLALTKLNVSQLQHFPEPEKNSLLAGISNLIDESCDELRSISHNLMPPDLDERSIVEILEHLIKKNREGNGTEYQFHTSGIQDNLSAACKFTLYRVLQEIMQNIIKHAAATKVTINLTQQGDFVHLLVEDNGKGFDTSLNCLGLGLKNIYSRIKLLDGYLDIDSSINKGTVLNVSIPTKA